MGPIAVFAWLGLVIGWQGPNQARIHGRFLDGANRPVVGADVVGRVWPGVDARVASGADGAFESVVEWDSDHRETYYSCTARALGCALWTYNGKLLPGQELDLGAVRLEPGGAVGGRLMLGSIPADGAWILVVPARSLPPEPGWRFESCPSNGPAYVTVGVRQPEHEQPVDRGRSAEDGSFHVIGLPPGPYGIWTRCDASYWAVTSSFDVRVGAETQLSDIVLEALPPQHRIDGLVLDPDGAPVPDADVSCAPIDRRIDCFHMKTHSGPDGRFRFFVLPLSCGAVSLEAHLEGRFFDTTRSPVEPGSGEVVLQFAKMHELAVQVVDADGSPIEDFRCSRTLYVGSYDRTFHEPEAIHQGGRVTLLFPDGANASLTIEANGFDRQEIEPDPGARQLTVTLTSLPAISGRVTAHGQPIPGAHVDLVLRDLDLVDDLIGQHESGLYYCTPGHCFTSDAAGGFCIPNEWPEYEYRARAWVEGFAAGYSAVVKGAAAGLELELSDGGTIAGHVFLPASRASGIVLRAHRADVLDSMHCLVGRQFRTGVKDDGSYRFEHLEPGDWLVAVELAPGGLQALGWSPKDGEVCSATPFVFTAAEGRTTNADIDLRTPGGACRLRGTLTVGDQIREGYAYLLLSGEQEVRVASSGVDSEGHFELATRTPGRYRLVVHAGPSHHRYRLVTDLVNLVPGETTWQRSLTLAEWKEEGVRLDRE